MRSRRGLGLLTASMVVLPVLATTGGATAPALAASASHTRMVAGYLSNLPLATRLGAAPADHVMSIGVSLARPDTSGELALYSKLYDPSSPLYHHFLTPAQFNREFGVPAAKAAAVRSFLASGGLKIETSSPDHDYFTAQGTVAQLDKLFSVKLGRYDFKGEHFIANNVPASVPDGLAINGITGLDNVDKFHLDGLTKPTRVKPTGVTVPGVNPTVPGVHVTVPGVHAVKSIGPQAGDQNEFTPQEAWGLYDDPGAAALTNPNGTSTPSTIHASSVALGQGQTMGIFGEGESSSVVAQLRLFEAAMGLPKVPVSVIETEGAPTSAYGDNTPAIEWYLDSQSSTGMAPDVSKLDFYFAKSLYDADVFQDFNAWANDPNGPREMNASFGECEENPANPVTGPLAQQPYGTEFGDELEAVGEPILRQAAIEGRTLFSSAGDTGSGCPEIVVPVAGGGNGVLIQPVPSVSYPCDSDYVVCVGGTVVSSTGTTYPTAGQRVAETSWTFGGGGTSHYVLEPKFQDGVTAVDGQCISTPSGSLYPLTSEPGCRGVPDVSDLSGNITGDGYFIYIDGVPSSEGGTSLSSPLMMGQWARIQSAASAQVQSAGGLGFADPLIYKQAAGADACSTTDPLPCTNSTYTRDFNDVTQSELGVGNGEYQPGPGWDYASGWGSLNVANFMTDVDGGTTAPDAAAPAELAAKPEATVRMTSPEGNATDPLDVSLGNDPSLDLTAVTITASATKGVTATLTGPDIGQDPPADATGGNSYFVAWEMGNTVYYARADESPAGAFTYTSGNTGAYGSGTYGYTDTTSSAATGSESNGTITIHIPDSEVGKPAVGSLLAVPQAFDQLDEAADAEDITTDSADDIDLYGVAPAAALSRGVAVRVTS